MNRPDEIKQSIHKINPQIAYELVDLFYEYVKAKEMMAMEKYIRQLTGNKEFEDMVKDLCCKQFI